MKSILTYFVYCLLMIQVVFAQNNTGIAVQGIARDAEKAALVDELMTFTFEILEDGGSTSYYVEDVSIKTDPYGVFSHIIGTGNVLAGSGNFNDIPYSEEHMKLVISVEYDGNVIEVSNAPFQYTPYAKSADHAKRALLADNGMPTGSITAYIGTVLPDGWTWCDGHALDSPEENDLKVLLGDTHAPDLRGMFLRGSGANGLTSYDGEDYTAYEGPGLKLIEKDLFREHNHGGKTSRYNGPWVKNFEKAEGDDGASEEFEVKDVNSYNISHTHDIPWDGGKETRPVNYGVHYIIKL